MAERSRPSTASSPPLPALLPPRGGGGSGAQRRACTRSSRGRASLLRSRRLPSAAPRPPLSPLPLLSPLPPFLHCPFPAGRGCACESSSPAVRRLPICSAPSALRGTRYGGWGPARGRAGRALFGAGERVEAAARAGALHSGNRCPCGPAALCCLFGARFLGPRSCPHGLKGVRPLPPCRGNGRAPAAGGCSVASGRELAGSPRVRVRCQGQALPLQAPRCSRGVAPS